MLFMAAYACGRLTARADSNGPLDRPVAIDLGGVNLELVLIPAGSFTMGDDNGLGDEKPAHQVTITQPFYLGRYDVTQEQWEAVMGGNPSYFKGRGTRSRRSLGKTARSSCRNSPGVLPLPA